MTTLPTIPAPYRAKSHAWPSTPLRLARHVETPDGASIACYAYAPTDRPSAGLFAGEVVLTLHGNGRDHGTFAQVIDTLCAAGLTVVAPDSRAQGASTRGAEPLTYELMAADALCVLDALGISRAHVLGHSDGGIEALLLARDHPSRVASVVAGGANLTPAGIVEDPAWDTAGSAQRNLAWARFLEQGDLPDGIDANLLPTADDARMAGELLQLMLDEPNIDAASLSAICCPTCVLVGQYDCIAREETDTIVAAIPGARLVVVPDAGHSLPRQAPDTVALQVMTNILLAR